jgi:5-methylcytosine-specific restriction endonuclease McrA
MTPADKRRLQRVAAGFNRKARRLHVPGIVSWQMLANKPGRCFYCPTELTLDQGTWDHQIAFDRGGTNEVQNIVRCCTSCQRRKFTKTEEEYSAHRELLVTCALPGCTKTFKPRWAEYKRGMARYCSHAHAGAARWIGTGTTS